MNQTQTDFDNFVLWFSKLNEIPLQTRHDFLNHAIKIGYLDDKAKKFIADTLHNLANKSSKRKAEWQKYTDLLQSVQTKQKTSENSLKKSLAKKVIDWTQKTAQNFKIKLQNKEKKIFKKEETAEDLQNQSEIARLKAAL